MQDSKNFFKENHYLKISNFLSKDVCNLLYFYILAASQRLSIIHEKLGEGNYNENRWGTFDDEQAIGDYSLYGDLIFDTILATKEKINELSKLTGLNLTPTYTYHRLYTKGTELKKHTDRESCEISATLCIGYNNSNMDLKKYPDWNWPMFIKSKNNETIPIHLKPGELIIYKGCEVEHWREPLEGLNHAQVFLHYNESEGDYENLFDGRDTIGLPHISNPIEPYYKNKFDINSTLNNSDNDFDWTVE